MEIRLIIRGKPAVVGFFIIVWCLTAGNEASADEWVCEWVEWSFNQENGEANSMALDSSDIPYISYQNDNERELRCAFKGASGWEVETLDSEGTPYGSFIGSTSIAIDSAGNPHIAYWDIPNCRLKYAYKENGDWYVSVVDEEGENGGHISLDIDSSDNPHIVYSGMDGFSFQQLKYAYRDGGGRHKETIDSVFEHNGNASLELDDSDTPHISYSAGDTDFYVRYGRRSISGWVVETVDGTGDYILGTAISLDSTGKPHICYCDNADDEVKYASYTGTTWDIEVICDIESYAKTCLALDYLDNPHVLFSEDGHLKYTHRDGSGWILGPDVGDTFGSFSYSLTTDSVDRPNISFIGDPLYHYFICPCYGYLEPATDTEKDENDTPNKPTGFALYPAKPNPASGASTISFTLPYACEVSLDMFDIKGRKVKTLAEGGYGAGEYNVGINGLSNGVYVYRLTADDFICIRKLIVK